MNFRNISKNKQFKESKYFEKLKSDYFLIKIIDLIKKNKSLEIIKYNKKIQKRLNININNYKEYSQLYSSIEIELKFADNIYGKFINMNDKYYHIYLNDNKEEIKRNYLNENDNVSKIKIIIDYQVKSFKELFKYCKCINSIFFIKFYRNNIVDMSEMFSVCSSLNELNLSNFNRLYFYFNQF